MSTTLDRPVSPPAESRIPAELAQARDLHRRLNEALEELGLGGALGPRWATPARSGFFFAPHNLHQAQRLVLGLERIGALLDEAGVEVAGSDPAAADGQLVLPFDDGPAPGSD